MDGFERFHHIDPSTNDRIVSAFTYVPTSNDSDYSAYRGEFDGQFMDDSTGVGESLRITRLEHIQMLKQADGENLVKAFGGR